MHQLMLVQLGRVSVQGQPTDRVMIWSTPTLKNAHAVYQSSQYAEWLLAVQNDRRRHIPTSQRPYSSGKLISGLFSVHILYQSSR